MTAGEVDLDAIEARESGLPSHMRARSSIEEVLALVALARRLELQNAALRALLAKAAPTP